MKRKLIITLALMFILVPALSQAAQFSVLGPRALGMGGASVAAVNDSTAVYWNPAALADYKKFEIRVPVSAAVRDHMDLINTWEEIESLYNRLLSLDLTAADDLSQLLLSLDREGTGTDLDASLGVFFSIPFSRSAIALSAVGISYAGMYPTIDTQRLGTVPAPCPDPNFVGCNTSTVTGIGLLSVEPTFSYATAVGDKLFIGANAKIISASTYTHTESILTTNYDDFLNRLDASETTSEEASLDAGILIAPTNSFKIGVVGRYLNTPSFPLDSAGEIELEPQYRAGIAWQPLGLLTLSADYDLSKNKTFVPGYEDQTFAVGGEITLPAEVVSFRGGFYKNTADSDANLVYTLGVGVRLFMFRLDAAGAYDFQEQEAQVSGSIALRF